MKKKAVAKKKQRGISPRYGIAEWFGLDITKMTPEQRQRFGHIAARQDQELKMMDASPCPFLSTLIPNAKCNKAGGVCTIRKYSHEGLIVIGDRPVTVCPNRFLQAFPSGKTIFEWVAEKMLSVDGPTIVKETPFLRKISDVRRSPEIKSDMQEEAKEEEKKAGRIDWILIDPNSFAGPELNWCALETQALYFSGGTMRYEFDAYAHAPSPVLFPVGKRRPDYRSSGPKRLWPQLDVKVPVLRNWGKKVVVVVDRFFFENMNTLTDPFPRARNDRERRDNADIAWFIVDYNDSMQMLEGEIIFTNLESTRHALNATEPLSKDDFTTNLREAVDDERRSHKVFKASKSVIRE